jgi:hypothetical protein
MMLNNLNDELRKAGAREVQVAALSGDPKRGLAALKEATERGAENVVAYAISLYTSPEWRASEGRTRQVTNASVETSCGTCHGDRFVTFATRTDGKAEVEEVAPCPDCNPIEVSFWRVDGSRVNAPDPHRVRERLARA